MASLNADPAQKLALIFKPLLEDMKKDIKENVLVQTQEILVHLGRLEAKIEVLEKLMGEKKKTTTREKKTATTASESEPKQPVAKAFPSSTVNYFKDLFKNNFEFREKWVTAELKQLMDADPVISSKTNEQSRIIVQSQFCWLWYKNNKPAEIEAIEKEYKAHKAMHESNNKPAQQSVEAHTPPNRTIA